MTFASVQTATERVKALRASEGVYEIPLIGEVEQYYGDALLSFLSGVKPTEVKFIIRSPGGLVFNIFDALDYMRANGIKAYCEVYGECMSAATLIAAYCTPERTAVSPSAMFGIHKASGSIGDDVFVKHANDRIVEMYRAAYGWSAAKVEKFLTANNGTGTIWMGSDIVTAGIADEMLDEMKVAAHMERFTAKQTPMGTIKVKAKLLAGWDTVKALATGEAVEVEIDANAELEAANAALAQATSDRQAAEAKVAELTDAEAAAQAKITALATEKETAEAAKVTADEQVVEVTAKLTAEAAKVTALQDRITELEKIVPADKTKALGSGDNQIPGGGVDGGKPVDPQEARMARIQENISKQRAERAKK